MPQAYDAARMAEASGLALKLFPEKIPLRAGATPEGALTDGEDYELLFAVPDRLRPQLEHNWPFAETQLSCIGQFAAGKPGEVSGVELHSEKHNTGYDHFQ